jgi:hypothetical protein
MKLLFAFDALSRKSEFVHAYYPYRR